MVSAMRNQWLNTIRRKVKTISIVTSSPLTHKKTCLLKNVTRSNSMPLIWSGIKSTLSVRTSRLIAIRFGRWCMCCVLITIPYGASSARLIPCTSLTITRITAEWDRRRSLSSVSMCRMTLRMIRLASTMDIISGHVVTKRLTAVTLS